MPWLVVGLSPRSLGFDPRSVCVIFVVQNVAAGPLFLQVLRFPPASVMPPILHSHFHLYVLRLQTEEAAAICLLHTCRRTQGPIYTTPNFSSYFATFCPSEAVSPSRMLRFEFLLELKTEGFMCPFFTSVWVTDATGM